MQNKTVLNHNALIKAFRDKLFRFETLTVGYSLISAAIDQSCSETNAVGCGLSGRFKNISQAIMSV